MRNELAQTFSDKQKVLSEAHGTDAGMLCTDSDTVGSDYVALQSSDGPDSGDLPSITAAIEQLKQDNASLDASRASDPASVPTGAPTDTQVSAAINAAQAKIDSVLAQARSMLNTAKAYANKAEAACNAAGG